MSAPEIVLGALALLNASAVLLVMRSGAPRKALRVLGDELPSVLGDESGPRAAAGAREVLGSTADEECRLRSTAGEREVLRSATDDDALDELVAEAERVERLETVPDRAEARLLADLGRWRARGEDRPRAAGSCHAETSPQDRRGSGTASEVPVSPPDGGRAVQRRGWHTA